VNAGGSWASTRKRNHALRRTGWSFCPAANSSTAVVDADQLTDDPVSDEVHCRNVDIVRVEVSTDVSDAAFVPHRVREHERAGSDDLQ
jgi:hypothetical protein